MQNIFLKITRPFIEMYEDIRKRHDDKRSHEEMIRKNLYQGLDRLRNHKGAFIAAPSEDYEACWIRDQLYCTLGYFYTGEPDKFKEGMWVVHDIFHKHREKIEHVICNLPTEGYQFIHAKYDHETLEEITHEWGHHQLDAIGLFLFLVGFAHREKIELARTHKDQELLSLLVQYLSAVRYWEFPDNGMWEENMDLHTSSIGAVVAGLTLIKEEGLAVVPHSLIVHGYGTLNWLLPNESPVRDVDMAQLSLIWPYHTVTPQTREEILQRVHAKLVQINGVNRYWGDNYYRSTDGVSGEWPMGFFWLSIIASDTGDRAAAREWFEKGCAQMTPDGFIPELYQNGKANDHTPLAWAHAMALIAKAKLT